MMKMMMTIMIIMREQMTVTMIINGEINHIVAAVYLKRCIFVLDALL